MHKMSTSAAPPKVGQLVYLPVEVKSGMFPTEVRFYANFLNGEWELEFIPGLWVANVTIRAQNCGSGCGCTPLNIDSISSTYEWSSVRARLV